MEAVELASPSLAGLLARVARGDTGGLKDKRLRRAALALLRYDIRMRTRPTPFGLFAGVSGGRFDTSAKWLAGTGHRTRTRADMEWLLSAVHRLERDRVLLAGVTVQAHQTLTVRGDRIVLDCPSALGKPLNGSTRSTVSARRSPVVAEILGAARRPVLAGRLAQSVAQRFELPVDRVTGLLADMAAQELLITALRPPLDGGDPLQHVLDVVATAEARAGSPAEAMSSDSAALVAALREVDARCHAYDRTAVGQGRRELAELIQATRRVHPHDTPLHVDLRIDLEVRLPEIVRTEIERAAEALWRLSPPRRGMRALRRYHEAFLERYGADRAVPLLELLDDTRGLGPPAGYKWPPSETPAGPQEEPRRSAALARLVATAARHGEREIVIDEETIAELVYDEAAPADLPNSLELGVHVVAPSLDELSAGTFRVVLAPGPGSHHAGATLGRFTGLLPDVDAESAARQAGRPLHIQDAVAADVAFIPRSGRAANLAHTPSYSGRRISVGLPDSGRAQELPLDELGVAANLERLCLVHLPTGREVVPALPNMVSAFAQAPNPARLLFELGLEGQRLWEPWDWGALSEMPFLPGVRYGRTLLAAPIWRMDQLRGPAADSGPAADWDAALDRWRAEWNVPRRVLAVSMDQRLLLDLGDAWHRVLLRDELRRTPELIAQQVAGDEEGWLDRGDGGFPGHLAEIVVPLERRDRHAARPPHIRATVGGREPTGAGGPWLYLRLRVPRRNQDDFLRDQVPVLVRAGIGHGADRWFFIRYSDTAGQHLRVRFRGEREKLWAGLLPEIGARLVEWQRQGLLAGHELGQYDPEYERYGGDALAEFTEAAFQHDSAAAISLLRLTRRAGFRYTLDEVTAISAAALAHAFGPPAPVVEPVPLVGGLQWAPDLFDGDPAAAWMSTTGARRELPPDYRREPARWQKLIDPTGGWRVLRADEDGCQVLAALESRDEAVRRFGTAFREASRPTDSPSTQLRLVGSLLHMTCNRLIGGSAERERSVLGLARGAVQDNLNRRRHRA
ncbi:lantibiotic dehydratase [Microbispora sp. ATCC PTA-5024]|uniref:lantibiotic dehydratase n=1 Tax=Microbispora sp. ATCC PTA-5024 TaxID=316330 RepID=UPI0003DD9CFA|nr:lantibiotic dehydratase [Microbispora sp. ATCC PTA-5024]ETK34054.1 lantibiotic dehydratase [Microbispora sp. ATCC PTA-5024]